MRASDVPIIKNNSTFVIYEEERLRALQEVQDGSDPAKRFESVVIVTSPMAAASIVTFGPGPGLSRL